jgi:hypothetical protein
VRQRAAGQRDPSAQRAVGRDTRISREGEKRRLVAEQEVENEAEELGVAGAATQIVQRGAAAASRPAARSGCPAIQPSARRPSSSAASRASGCGPSVVRKDVTPARLSVRGDGFRSSERFD